MAPLTANRPGLAGPAPGCCCCYSSSSPSPLGARRVVDLALASRGALGVPLGARRVVLRPAVLSGVPGTLRTVPVVLAVFLALFALGHGVGSPPLPTRRYGLIGRSRRTRICTLPVCWHDDNARPPRESRCQAPDERRAGRGSAPGPPRRPGR